LDITGTESSDDDAEGPAAIPITVKFTHKSNDKTKISQEQSHHQHLMKTAEEPGCETDSLFTVLCSPET
jgi:hypothetical protein